MTRAGALVARLSFATAAALLLAGAAVAQAPPGDGAGSAPSAQPAAAEDAGAQDAAGAGVVRVAATVAAVSGGGVYLDKGRDAHIEPGDAVVIQALGGPAVPGVIQSVSRTSARAALAPGAPAVAIGDRAEVLVPKARLVPAPAAGDRAAGSQAPAVPEHPPWSAGAEDFDADRPLLAPAAVLPAAEKPMLVDGRWFSQFNGVWDTENHNAFELARTGVELNAENPAGTGGRLHLLGEVNWRASDISGGEDDRDTAGRLDRASWTWGGTREDKDRVEAGRFLQNAFPELGVLDGVEAAHRTDSGDWFGASFGYMPEPFPDMKTGRDLQVAVYYRTGSESGRAEPLALGLAYQNTWHEGSQDRNLFVGTLDAELSETVSLDAAAEVDLYGPGGDSIYRDGLSITDAWARGQWRPADDAGLGLHVSRVRWPEMKRDEFADLTPQQIADSAVTRYGADGWYDVSQHLRVDGRLDLWSDDEDSGSSSSLRAALRDVAWERGEVSVEVFCTDGTFTEGHGLRVSLSRSFESLGAGALSWETSTFTSGTELDGNDDKRQQALRASLDTTLGLGLGEDWSLSLYGERRFGDEQGSHTLGIYVQERF
jgi:hypothetical protein